LPKAKKSVLSQINLPNSNVQGVKGFFDSCAKSQRKTDSNQNSKAMTGSLTETYYVYNFLRLKKKKE
jgi:hypothetical protein